MTQKTAALPIRSTDFSDSSQIVSLFTREFGLVEAIAKGAHRDKNPFQGPFDLAVLYEVVFLQRGGSNLAILTEATVIEGFRGVRRTWPKHRATSHLLELLRAVATAGEAEPELFDLTLRTLERLADPSGLAAEPIVMAFDAGALQTLGFLAPIDACVECGLERPDEERPVFLSPRARGVLCRFCRSEAPDPGGVTLPGPAVRLWARLAAEDLTAWKDQAGVSEHSGKALSRALSRLRTTLLERELVLLQSSASWT